METNLTDSIAYCEAVGLSKVWKAYAEDFTGEDIFSVGFNPNSGLVYIYLEVGISITSFLGREVDYYYDDPDTGESICFLHDVNELKLYMINRK